MTAEFCSKVTGWEVVITWALRKFFRRNTDVVGLGVVTKKKSDDSSLTVFATNPVHGQRLQRTSAENISSNQKLHFNAYELRFPPSPDIYRTVDGSMMNSVEPSPTNKKYLLDNKSVKKRSRIAQITSFIGPQALVCRLRRLVEIDFDTKHPILLDTRQTFVNLFLRHTHLKNYHQMSKEQERFAILKLISSLLCFI